MMAQKTKAKKKTNKKAKSQLEQWPRFGRGTLFRPQRAPYLKRVDRNEAQSGCVFCEALNQGLGSQSLLLYFDENSMVVLNKFPYNSGHLLVLPRRHVGDVLEIEEAEFNALMKTFRKAIDAVQRAYECQGLNAGLNLGRAAGAGIPQHLHWHIIPRWTGDLNFFPLIGETKVVIETLEQTYARLLPFFK